MNIDRKVGLPFGTRSRSQRSADSVDAHVGKQLRAQRTLQGMSQGKLGEALGLTFQQVQKYERGANRIGASRLYQLSKIFGVPVDYFFQDYSETLVRDSQLTGFSETGGLPVKDPLMRRETLELVRSYYGIKNAKARKAIFELIKAMAKDTSHAEKENLFFSDPHRSD